MTALIGLLMFISIWIPVAIAVFTASDKPEQAGVLQHLKSKKTLVSAAVVILLELTTLYAQIKGAGPFRALVGAFIGRTTYQSIARWCLALLLSLPLAAVIGCAVRYYFSGKRKRVWHPIPARKKAILTLTAISAAVPLILGIFYGFSGTKHLRIVEVCREQSTLGEADGEEDISYLVLKNTGSLPCATDGLQIAADDTQRTYSLLSATIPAGDTSQFKDQKDRFADIKKSGGSVLKLLNAYGEELDAVALPEMPDDTAYRLGDAGWQTCSLTPNAADAQAEIPAPTVSRPGGFYDEAFSLELSAPEGCEIYYTLDGSVPTVESQKYTGPIRVYDRSAEPNRFRSVQNVQKEYLSLEPIGTEPVDKAFIVRAVSQGSDGACSPVLTETYFVGLADYGDKTVVSLVADPEDLFGENGIYVTGSLYDAWEKERKQAETNGSTFGKTEPTPNFMQRGAAWERTANVQLFSEGMELFNQNAGIRIQGSFSRQAPLKRFSVYARTEYDGSRFFDVPIFSGSKTHSFVLRTGFDNAFSHQVCMGRAVAALRTVPVSVFLNGEFWYDTFLQEKYSASFFSEQYQVAKDDVECIQIGYWENLPSDEKSEYQKLRDLAMKLDMSQEEDYRSFEQVADLQSYIDYACIQAYLGNSNSHETLNICVWRTLTNEFSQFGDHRWRWALYDMDLMRSDLKKALGYERTAVLNTFSDAKEGDEPLLSGGVIWESLKASPIFRQQFVLTFMDLINTTFSVDRVTALLEAWGKDISYDDYFFRDRAGYITKYMEQELGLSGTQETLTLTTDAPEHGTVELNTITPDLSSGSWSGKYYTDYPVSLTAVPAEGHTFVAWEINGKRITDPAIEAKILKGGSTVHVIFQ